MTSASSISSNPTFWNEAAHPGNAARGLSGFGRIAFGFLWILIFTLPGEKVLVLPRIGTISRLAGLVAIGAGILAIVEARRFRRPAPAHLAMAAFTKFGRHLNFLAIAVNELFDASASAGRPLLTPGA